MTAQPVRLLTDPVDRLIAARGIVVIDEHLADAIRQRIADAALQGAEVARLLFLRDLTAAAVETEHGPAVPLREVRRLLGGPS